MNRRSFLVALSCLPFVKKVTPVRNVPAITWNDIVRSEVPMFVGNVSLYGVPYHQFNASVGQWMGFEREANGNGKLDTSTIQSPLRTL